MKTWISLGAKWLFGVLFFPQVFLFLYYFRFLFAGHNWLGMWKALFLYGLTVSWVSAPLLIGLFAAVHACVRSRVNAMLVLGGCVLAGFAWLTAWNLCVYPVFTYGRAALPILLCAVGSTAYVQARALYAADFGNKSSPAGRLSQAEGLHE